MLAVPIRIRIILLALFSLLFLMLVILSEYSHVKSSVLDAKKSSDTVEEVSFASKLIHSLQKERGLSALYLVEHNKEIYDKLATQRQSTDNQLKKTKNILLFKNIQNSSSLEKKIEQIRSKIDNSVTNWQEVKEFYTLEINKLLTQISLELIDLKYSKEVSYQLYGIVALSKARENLGLLRANISRYYQKEELTRQELLEINHKYNVFIEQLELFKLYIKKTPCDNLKIENNKEILNSVQTQILSILKESKDNQEASALIWWKEATSVIDAMKETEDYILNRIEKYSSDAISVYEKHLLWYVFTAIIALLLIAALTASTVVRILKALSVLINSLNKVEETQDFGLRLSSKSKDEFGQLSFSINRLLNYTDQILKEKDKLASIDLLTGIMNRRSFMSIAEREVEQSKRYDKPLSVIFCDIDRFKFINDTYGHDVGDEVLKSFANAARLHIRKGDYIVRWGGEEFIILAPETNESQATELAENLRKVIMKLSFSDIKEITCSFGVAQMQENESLESLHRRADKAMYMAKELGRNRVCVANAI